MIDLSRVLLVRQYFGTEFPDIIVFNSVEELVAFRRLVANQFEEVDTCAVYHTYSSGDEWLEDYGLLESEFPEETSEDADDEEEE